MNRLAIAGAVASVCLAGASVPAAHAASQRPAIAKQWKVTVSPSKPKSGATVTAKLTHGPKNTTLVCILATYKPGGSVGESNGDISSAETNIKTNSKGDATCQQVFTPFKTANGHSCPPTKADKKVGYGCGVAFANAKERNDYKVGLFKF